MALPDIKVFDPSQSLAKGLQVASNKRAEAREDRKLDLMENKYESDLAATLAESKRKQDKDLRDKQTHKSDQLTAIADRHEEQLYNSYDRSWDDQKKQQHIFQGIEAIAKEMNDSNLFTNDEIVNTSRALGNGMSFKEFEARGYADGVWEKDTEDTDAATTDMKEYVFAQENDGFTGSFQEWQSQKSDRTRKEKTPKTPTPVNWQNATRNLTGRFGSQDKLGNIMITEGLQGRHRVAQKKLVELKNSDIAPLDAVNQAEEYANAVEAKYWEWSDAIDNSNMSKKEKEAKKKELKKAFKKDRKYLPTIRR
jgi:hypothetical protein